MKFTENLQRHADCSPLVVQGRSVREVLEAVFLKRPVLRGYILDDQSALRKHMTIFINGELIQDRNLLTDAVTENGVVFVMQALSGG